MKLIKLNAIDSTNNYLKALSKKVRLQDSTVVTAEIQTRGRGQMDAGWYMEAGKSLAFSVFKDFKSYPVELGFDINLLVSLGLVKGFNSLGIQNVRIKWPNDIMSDTKKLCGVLIENQLKGNAIVSSVIGVGVNVNNRELSELPGATSLFLREKRMFNLEEVLDILVKHMLRELQRLELETYEMLKSEYLSHLFRYNQVSVFENLKGKKFNGIIREVTRKGELLVAHEDGSLRPYKLKEIRLHH